MIDLLRENLTSKVDFREEELNMILHSFVERRIEKNDHLLRKGEVCNLIGFIAKGCIRCYRIKDGKERTGFISFENSWITEIDSLSNEVPSEVSLQCIEDTVLYLIDKQKITALYAQSANLSSFARMTMERIAALTIKLNASRSSESLEERYNNLLQQQPELFQRVPQRHIANMLGVQPESLSRIKNRIFSSKKS